MNDLIMTPRGWLEAFGEMTKFGGRMVADIVTLRVFKFFGEALRQAGILIVSSTLVIFGPGVHHRVRVRDRGRLLHLRQRARRRTPGCSRPGVTCASWCRSCSAT